MLLFVEQCEKLRVLYDGIKAQHQLISRVGKARGMSNLYGGIFENKNLEYSMSNQITNKEVLAGKPLSTFALLGYNPEDYVGEISAAAHYVKGRHYNQLLWLGSK